MAGDITGTPEVNKVIINNEVILDLTQDTVTTDKMVSGVTAHDKSGKQIAGTMGELAGLAYTGGAITTPGSGGSYSIPASYIPEDTRYVKGNDETVVNVTIPKTKFGNATVADVVKGKTFSSAEGIAQTGSMEEVDQFELGTEAISDVGSNYVFPVVSENSVGNLMAGYVNKATDYNVFVPKSEFGNATSGNVLKGKTYTSADGLKKTGTMPNNGAAAIQLSDLTAKSVTAGYYSGGTAKIADAEAAKIIPENIKKGVTILGVEGAMEEGGPYNIAATTNSDGTQSLAITDAGGGSSGTYSLPTSAYTIKLWNFPSNFFDSETLVVAYWKEDATKAFLTLTSANDVSIEAWNNGVFIITEPEPGLSPTSKISVEVSFADTPGKTLHPLLYDEDADAYIQTLFSSQYNSYIHIKYVG